jgi:[acyl-carrier-protein] S-malonyltransferase
MERIMKIALVFPGQGSQKVGMGADVYSALPNAQRIFDTADRVLGKSISDICFNGPEDVLKDTRNAQPGLFLVSAALIEALAQKGIRPDVVAGHSLGELTAYYAAGVLSLEDTLKLIQARSEAMSASYPSEDSAMAAVMKLDLDIIETVLSDFKETPVVAANLNCPGQIVISGTKGGVEAAGKLLSEKGARLIPLPVSGAFHSPLMQKGAAQLEAALQTFTFADAQVPIVLNRLATPVTLAGALKENVSLQVVSPVRWIDSVQYIASQVDVIIECGAGKVLSGLCKKIVPDFPVYSVSSVDDIAQLSLS